MKKKYNLGGQMSQQELSNLSNMLSAVSTIAPMFGPVGMGVGIAASIGGSMTSNAADKKARGPHLSNFRGYNTGGPIQIVRDNTYVNPVPNIDPASFMLPAASKQFYSNPANSSLYDPTMFNFVLPNENVSKYPKDRFREKAMGGLINVNDNTQYVNGSESKIDSVYDPKRDVYLDNKEIVKNNFVFSNRINNPVTGRSFAADASTIERKNKAAQDKITMFNDNISKNTQALNSVQTEKLARQQEMIANALGLRSNKRTAYNTGGPIYMDVSSGGGLYYDPYNDMLLKRDSKTGQYNKYISEPVSNYRPSSDLINNHLKQYPAQSVQPATSNIDLSNIYSAVGTDKFPSMRTESTLPQNSTPFVSAPPNSFINLNDLNTTNSPAPTTNPTTNPISKRVRNNQASNPQDFIVPGSDLYSERTFPLRQKVEPLSQIPYQRQKKGDPLTENLMPRVESTQPRTITGVNQPSTLTSPMSPASSYNMKFTTGDYMQMGAALSRLANIQRPEVELPTYDLTQVTKNSYDINPVLQQNNRNFQNAVNNIDGLSNIKRAFTQQLYADKLNSDSQAMAQYQQMNNNENTVYEDRLSNRARYNNQQTQYTRDINARNRAQAFNMRQSAVDQMGNLGIMLNQKQQSDAYVQALKIRYPEVSENILNALLNGQ